MQEQAEPVRTILCQDALPWLRENTAKNKASFITSLPDVSGLPEFSLAEWKAWFREAARLTLAATPDDGVTIFYQTDIKVDGTWVDKSFLCHQAAEEAGVALLWHKIFCRKKPGEASFGRPGYTHLLCYSRGVRDEVSRSYADVFSSQGEMTWSRAMGLDACEFAVKYVKSHTQSSLIVDPFCGMGSVLAVANKQGLPALGIELSRRRAKRAKRLRVE